MNVAVLDFATKTLVGVVDDEDAGTIEEFFALERDLGPADLAASEFAATAEASDGGARGPIVRLEHPGRIESSSWFQPSRLDPQKQDFVVQNFVALIGATRLRVDVAKAVAVEVFRTTDSHTAQIGAEGVKPAGEPTSAEPLVQRYLAALNVANVKPVATGLGRGRRKVPSETTP